jgi:hypothetical protein
VPKGDPAEIEMKDLEGKIMEQIISAFTYQ